jgi:Uma2 family endonuclease
MASVVTKSMTAEEFYEWANRPENGGGLYELERGEVVDRSAERKHSPYRSMVCAKLTSILADYASRNKGCYVCCNSTGLILERDPDTVLCPDISFFDDERTPDTMERGFTTSLPRLVVEVMAWDQRVAYLKNRAARFLDAGIRCVWLVDHETKMVSVQHLAGLPNLLIVTETIHGDDVLPDFQCKVGEFFTRPGQ